MKSFLYIKSGLAVVLLTIILFVAQPLMAGVYVELVDTVGNEIFYIYENEPAKINVRLNNNTGETLTGVQHGFRIYSPTGANWQPITYETSSGFSSLFDFVNLQGFGITGSGEDTVGLSAIASIAPGVPNGYDDIILTIITAFNSGSNPDTFCIDSSFYPQSGTWTWATSSGSILPDWEGPYCYAIVLNTSISGTKFHDENGNSVWDVGEVPIDDVTIKLHGNLDAGGTVDKTTITDLSGNYTFINLAPGDYWIQEEVKTFWATQTYPLTVMHSVQDLVLGQHLTGYDFGNDTLCEEDISVVTCLHGTDDNFSGPEPSNMSTGLHDYFVNNAPGGLFSEEFDQPADNRWFGHTFDGCWDANCMVTGATLRIKVQASGSGCENDFLILGDYSQGTFGRIWSDQLADLELLFGGDGVWNVGDVMTVVLDLEALPVSGWLPTNILAALQDGDLDIMVTDDSYVDFIEMEVELCCGCSADGDANNDGLGLSVSDMAYLSDFINGNGPAPIPLYSCDLNGDGYVNAFDIDVYNDYFIYGLSAFAPYGGYPVVCPCDPIAEVVPDTVIIFGLEHVSLGTASFSVESDTLNVDRISMEPTEVHTNADDDTILVLYIPPEKAAGSGGGPYGTSISNLEDAGIVWQVEYEEDTTLDAGASVQVFAYVEVDIPEYSITVECSSVQTKQENDTWALGVNSYESSYNVKAYLGDDLVWSLNDIEAVGDWFQPGNMGPVPEKAAGSGGGPYGTSISNLEDAGIVEIEYTEPDTVLWNWDAEGVSDMQIDRIVVSFNRTGERMTVASIGAYNIPSYTIVSESQAVAYNGMPISNLGNAILNVVDTTLVVSNIGSSGEDGVDAEADKDDGNWSLVEIILENPNLGGTFPIGGSIRVGYEYASSTSTNNFPAESFFDFAGSNTWNLGVVSDTDSYTVIALNDNDTVFQASGVDANTLGYIVETAKGVYPVGFSGSANGKPSTLVATADFDFTASPSGVQWSWSAQSVSGLTIDYLSVTHDGLEFYLDLGVHSFSITGQDGTKAGPISLTILNINAEFALGGCCDLRGDSNDDGTLGISDLTFFVDYLFNSGPAPNCEDEADNNNDDVLGISDLTYFVDYLFNSGPAPVACD